MYRQRSPGPFDFGFAAKECQMVNDKRVCFDFEIEFLNGGGIQGQGFRLDIEGETIADDTLAAYIVADKIWLFTSSWNCVNGPAILLSNKVGILPIDLSAIILLAQSSARFMACSGDNPLLIPSLYLLLTII
jgi:hypothetical protein